MKDITTLLKSAIEGNKESKKTLQSIEQGLYLMVFNPSESIYEMRKNKKHTIESNTVVIKPGKFENGLFSRICSYNKVWLYESNDQSAFLNNVTVYLISDLTGTIGHYVRSLEHNYLSITNNLLKLVKHEKSASSEWMISLEEITEEKILNIYNELDQEIKHDMQSKSRLNRYNLNILK